jgi:hypothetical protein
MNNISLNKSEELELGEIPNTSEVTTFVEVKPIKPANSPLARLFFDPTKLASSPLQIQSDTANDVSPSSEHNRTESSHS